MSANGPGPKDLDEAVRAGTTLDEILARAEPFSPETEGKSPGKEPLRLVRADEINIHSEPNWLIRGLVPAEGCFILAGEPKAGKTWLAGDLGVSVCTGTPFLGREVVSPGPVLYFPLEDAIPSWGGRVDGLLLARGRERAGLSLHAIDSPGLDLGGGASTDVERLREVVEKVRPRLVILDPFSLLHGGDENNAPDVLAPLQRIRLLQRTTGAAFLLVHHMRKPNGTTGRRAHRIRGSSAIHGWADLIFLLEVDEKRKGVRLDIETRTFAAPPPLFLRRCDAIGDDGRKSYWHDVDAIEDDPTPDLVQEAGALDERVFGFLGGNPTERITSVDDLARRIGKKAAAVREAVRRLTEAGRLTKADGVFRAT